MSSEPDVAARPVCSALSALVCAVLAGAPSARAQAQAPPDPAVEAVATIAHDLVSRPERCTWIEPLMPALRTARPQLATELTALCTRPIQVTGDARAEVDGVDLSSTGGRAWIGPRRLTLVSGDRRVDRGLCVAPGGVTRVDAGVAASAGGTVAERALAHEVAAFTALEAGDRCTAVAELSAAYAEVPAPGYTFNIALAYAEWPGHCTDARRAFEALLARCEACAEGPRARERLAELATTCSSTVVVRAPAPFVVRLGEREIATSTPDPVRPGQHRADSVVPSGLQVLAIAPTSGPAQLRAVALGAGERAELVVPLEVVAEARSPTRTFVAIGAAGLAAVALGTSAALAGAYGGASGDLDALPARGAAEPGVPLVDEAESLASAGNGYRTGVYVALGVGVASAVVSAVLWLWPDSGTEEAP